MKKVLIPTKLDKVVSEILSAKGFTVVQDMETPFLDLAKANPDAEALGWMVEGTWTPYRKGADGAMLLEKHFPEWTSIWSASPNMPSALLGMFAERAGVHLYTSRGDQVFQSKQWLGVHCKWNGMLELHFPERGSWRDAFSGALLVENGDCIRLATRRGENLLLERE